MQNWGWTGAQKRAAPPHRLALAQPLDVRCRAVLVATPSHSDGGVGSAALSLDQLQARTRLSEDDVLVALKSLVALQY